jgi:hypothetical protein
LAGPGSSIVSESTEVNAVRIARCGQCSYLVERVRPGILDIVKRLYIS